MSSAQIVLWVYIALVVVGGVMGFVKAGSKVSLVASLLSAAVLALFATDGLPIDKAWMALVPLLAMFAMRYVKTKKFMPAGLMIVLTIAALAALFMVR